MSAHCQWCDEDVDDVWEYSRVPTVELRCRECHPKVASSEQPGQVRRSQQSQRSLPQD